MLALAIDEDVDFVKEEEQGDCVRLCVTGKLCRYSFMSSVAG